jgi:ribosomal-protein-serine acetyltransferase
VNPLYVPLGDDAFLRTFAPDDAVTLYALVDQERDRLRHWMPWPDNVRSVEEQRTWIERSLASEHDREANGIWLRDGELAGTVGMTVTTVDNGAEVGYWIAERYEGRGLATRAAAAMIDLAFGELQLHRVTLRAAVINEASRAVAERLGFTQEGVLREQGLVATGEYLDMAVYGLLAREWKGLP